MSENQIGVSKKLKRLHQQFLADKKNPDLSLKDFLRTITDLDTKQMVAIWVSHKRGSLEEPRSEKNQIRATQERQATKMAKRKSK